MGEVIVTTHKGTISDIIDGKVESPLPIEVIPNYMGINLCSVDSISWVRLNDGQLLSLTIHFSPDLEEYQQ